MNNLKEYILEKFKISKDIGDHKLITGHISDTLFNYLGVDDETDDGEFYDKIDDWVNTIAIESGEILMTQTGYNDFKKAGCPDYILNNFTIISKDKYNSFLEDYKKSKSKWEYTGPVSKFKMKATVNYLILDLTPDNMYVKSNEQIIFNIYKKKYGELG